MERHAIEALDTILAGVPVTPDRFPAVLVGEALLLHDAREAVEAAGGRVLAEIGWAALGREWSPPALPCVLVLDTGGAAEEVVAAALTHLGDAERLADAPIVLTVECRSIDLAVALTGPRTQILCEPDAADRMVALTLAARTLGHAGLHDNSLYENEAARLQRLNEEVARIAEVLSRLSRREAAQRREDAADVFDRRQSFEVRPMDDVAIDPGEIRRAIKGRRLRDQFFGGGLFEEPGWDMVLDLFAAELERSRVSVSSLCIAAAVAPTTALRWISKLTEAGLFERRPDPFDRRRAYMELSERAGRAMRDYVGALRRAGLSLA